MSEPPESLFQRVAGQARDGIPPVHLWHPTGTKDIGIRITRDGTWWHQGSPITRERMVRMFSRVLRREGGDYFLVTPVEKVRVDVEVAPLLAVRMEVRGDGRGGEIAFETNTGDVVVADQAHPVRMLGTAASPLPVVVVRDDIEALIVRSVFYELIDRGEIVESGGVQRFVLHSRGARFELGRV